VVLHFYPGRCCTSSPILTAAIGHALIADALEFGFAEAVRKYLAAANNP